MWAVPIHSRPSDKVYVNDPACGAGAMLLAFGRELLVEQANRVVFVAQDIDFYCCQMTALNLMFYNYDALIIHGDTLALEVRSAWRTHRSLAYGGSIKAMDADEAKRIIESPFLSRQKEEAKPKQPDAQPQIPRVWVKPVQLSLFG